MTINIGILCLIFGVGISAISYRDMAMTHGWPIGEILSRVSATTFAAGFACIGAVVRSIQIYAWWTSIVVVVGGFVLGLIMTRRLRKTVQYPAIIGSWAGLFVLPVLPLTLSI